MEGEDRRCIDSNDVPVVVDALTFAADAWSREARVARRVAGEHRYAEPNPVLEPGEQGAQVMDVMARHYDERASDARRIAGELGAA